MIWKTILVVALATVSGTLANTLPSAPACFTENFTNEALISLATCTDNVVNLETVLNEMNANKTIESYKVLFQKYYPKLPQLQSCVQNFVTAYSACFDQSQRELFLSILNQFYSAISLLSRDDGAALGEVIVEDGIQCIQRTVQAREGCRLSMFTSIYGVIDQYENNQIRCRIINEYQSCILDSLRSCSSMVMADLFEILVPFLTSALDCTDFNQY